MELDAAPRSRRRGGFTLLEMMVVILIIGVLSTFLVVNVPQWLDRAQLTACEQNMRRIWSVMVAYQTDHNGQLPRDDGPRFFLRLWKDKLVEQNEQNARMFFCPATDPADYAPEGVDVVSYLNNWEAVGPGYTSYAGLSVEGDQDLRTRVRKGSGTVTVLADASMNHRTALVYMTADGQAHRLTIAEIEDRTGLNLDNADDMARIAAGPGSPLEELRTVQ